MKPKRIGVWEPVRLRRTSHETEVTVELAVGSPEEIRVELPSPLIAHGVESFAAWADLPLRLKVKGDLDHHAVEDAALVLGRAIRKSLGDEARERVGESTVPMDESLVQVVLDLSNRPYAEIDPAFPSMVRHFLRSLSDEARWTLHVRILSGEDEHHRVEAAFKALGMALAGAARPRVRPRSRKGEPAWSEG